MGYYLESVLILCAVLTVDGGICDHQRVLLSFVRDINLAELLVYNYTTSGTKNPNVNHTVTYAIVNDLTLCPNVTFWNVLAIVHLQLSKIGFRFVRVQQQASLNYALVNTQGKWVGLYVSWKRNIILYRYQPIEQLLKAAMHETLHFMGLTHVPKYFDSIMTKHVEVEFPHIIGLADIRKLFILYGNLC